MQYNYEYEKRKNWRWLECIYWTALWRQASTPELKEAYRQRMLNAESVLMNYKGMEL